MTGSTVGRKALQVIISISYFPSELFPQLARLCIIQSSSAEIREIKKIKINLLSL